MYLAPVFFPFRGCISQGAYGSGTSKSYELKLGNFLRIGSVGVVVSEIHTGAGGEHKCLSWEELTCLKGDIAAIQKVTNNTRQVLDAFREPSVFFTFPYLAVVVADHHVIFRFFARMLFSSNK